MWWQLRRAGTHSLALKSDGTVVAWGDNDYGQTNVPPGLTNVVAIAGGDAHSLALKSDGTVVAWGYNNYGQTNVPPGLKNVVAIAGGGDHSLALGNLPPVISTEPQSQTVMAGSNVTFSVSATSPCNLPLSYQWYFNCDALADANSATLTLTNVQSTNTGNYWVVAANAAGGAVSSIATLTVIVMPTNIPNLLMWLKADAGVTNASNRVNSWPDQSGNGNNA